jgi:Tol biopolymer transport system component
MLQTIVITVLAVGIVAAQGVERAQSQSAATMFESARKLETVDGDLKGAIKQYEAIVTTHGADRATVANALLRMGECYQKLGDQQATKLFERTVREYPEQKQAASAASARLARRPADVVAAGVLNRQVWAGPEVDSMGTISSDGRHLSFVDWDTGDLAVRDMATGAKRRLTDKGPWEKSVEFAESSAFSRDGSLIAYAWFNGNSGRYDLRIIRADARVGTAPRVLFDNSDVSWVAPYDWTPDGKRIVVQIQRRDRTAQIGLIATADGSFQPLQTTDWRGSSRLSLSPDGSLLAFDLPDTESSGGRDAYVLRLDGKARFRVAQHPADDTVVGWSPDGGLLLFASDRSGSTSLWSVPVLAGRPGTNPALLRANVGHVRDSLGLDRSGGLVYSIRTSATTIAMASLDLEHGTATSGPTTPFENYLSSLRSPDWSKDGTLIAIAEESRTRLALTFRTADGKRLRDVSIPMGYAQRPRWAPDGTITVQGVDLQGRSGIHRFDPGTSEVTPLVLADPGMQVVAHTWLPGGLELMFQRNTENLSQRSLVVRNLQTSAERVLVEDRWLQPGHTLSPNGSHVVYGVRDQQQGGKSTLYVLDIVSGRKVEIVSLTQPAHTGGLTLWTPDGGSILFSRVDKQQPSLWVVNATGGTPRPVDLEIGPGHGSMRMHPDGQRVAYNTGRNALELWRLDNFLPSAPAGVTRR